MDGSAITHLPAFRAPATTGQELSLDTFLQKVPLAIVFLAGIEEDAELLRAFDEALPRFGAERAQLLVVAPLSHRPGGVAAARNLGVAASTSPVVAFCDDDSRWAPGALDHVRTAFAGYDHLGLVSARILVGAARRPDPVSIVMAADRLGSERLPGPRILGFLACGAAVRRKAYMEVGGFPSEYVIGGEEEPLALSLAAAGWELAYLEDAVVHHVPSPDGRSSEARDRRVVRNDLWTAWRHRSPWGAFRRSMSIIGRADSSAKRAGVADAIRQLPRVLSDRRPIPPHVERMRRSLEQEP